MTATEIIGIIFACGYGLLLLACAIALIVMALEK
jgi:hypothetical protein